RGDHPPSILSFLLDRGGKVNNSDFLNHFRSRINSDDPAETQYNRDRFKKLVNSVAVVKTMDETKFVVVKNRYLDFIKDAPHCASPKASASSVDATMVRVLNIPGHQAKRAGKAVSVFAVVAVKSPPRTAAVKDELHHKATEESTFVTKVSPTKLPTSACIPACKSDDALSGEGTKYSESVPLDHLAHEWLVKCAAGLWGQVYALLLKDVHLIQRRDFMSGFTVLHWAAKEGNSEIIMKILGITRERDAFIDLNSKAHGGYTPLHIAAIHERKKVMFLLVRGYGANVNVRDNDGKKAFHYLSKNVSAEVRALLGHLLTANTKRRKMKRNTKNNVETLLVSGSIRTKGKNTEWQKSMPRTGENADGFRVFLFVLWA
uniref:Sosondowah ankyrin repeat domain family member Ab n=1 Tax=Neogobius melanostomus TaxID=47308 RepID=A0A8C6SB69_9GOBI